MQAIARRSSQQIGQSLFPSFDPKSVAFIFILLLDHLSSIFFAFFYNSSLPFPSILFTTRLLLFHLSRLVSLKFPSGLQQPFLHFFPLRSRYISLFFPVFLLLFFPSATTLPFYFFFLLIFLRRGLCFRPPSLPLHFWPVTGLIRDFDAETWKSSIETNRLRGATVCGGIDVCVCNTNEIK